MPDTHRKAYHATAFCGRGMLQLSEFSSGLVPAMGRATVVVGVLEWSGHLGRHVRVSRDRQPMGIQWHSALCRGVMVVLGAMLKKPPKNWVCIVS